MFGLDPEEGQRSGSRKDPLNLTGVIDDKGKAEADWTYTPEGEKAKGQRLSEIGHGNIAPSKPGDLHGGVTISEARRDAWISLAALERLRFGDADPEAATLARAALAALALAGDRLAFDRPSAWLRSGCDLVRVSELLAFERDGGDFIGFRLTAGDAIEVFHELRDRAAAAGISMESDTIVLQPIASLAAAIENAVTKATGED
jgi:CRISPR-associated protein Csb1